MILPGPQERSGVNVFRLPKVVTSLAGFLFPSFQRLRVRPFELGGRERFLAGPRLSFSLPSCSSGPVIPGGRMAALAGGNEASQFGGARRAFGNEG
jgi:hypothetical protein